MVNFNDVSNWCGAKPIFYNKRTGEQSTVLDNVIDWGHAEIDHEGLYYYLKNGYSSFGKTFVKDVMFSRPWSNELDANSAEEFQMFMEQILYTSSINDVLGSITKSLAEDTRKFDNIIIPMSGGLDSRTLGILAPTKGQKSAYTYSLVEPALKCHEFGIASQVCNNLGIQHTNIELKNPYEYVQNWFDDFGYCTQTHGMYHYEFYNNISKNITSDSVLLSGIVGDLWSGKISTAKPHQSDHLFSMSYSHGQNIPQKYIKFNVDTKAMDADLKLFSKYWGNHKFRIYYLITTKMMLLRFLMKAPESQNLRAVSPYLDPIICSGLLNLPYDQWSGRRWQREWLSSVGMNFDKVQTHFMYTKRNNLNYNWAVNNYRDEELDVGLLSEVLEPEFVSNINAMITASPSLRFNHLLLDTPKLGGLMRRLGAVDRAVQTLDWYNILLPVSKFLKASRDV